MAERSQFLAMLAQPGWKVAQLTSPGGRASASLRREGPLVEVELWEGGQLLAKMEGAGVGAREVLGSLRAQSGAYVDMLGEEGAWAKSVEALLGMVAGALGMEVGAGDRMGAAPEGLATRRVEMGVFGGGGG